MLVLHLLISCGARLPPTPGGSPDQRLLGQELQQGYTVEDQKGKISEIDEKKNCRVLSNV